jgi:flagellar motor protein MotB
MAHLKKWLIGFCLLASASFAEASGVVSERIYFLAEDGRHALIYTTSRSDYSNYNMWFRSEEGYETEDYLKDFLYIYPEKFRWDTVSRSGYSLLKLPGRSFAILERVEFEKGDTLQVTEDGVYTFNNWGDKVKTPDGHYGLWNSPDNFQKIAYSWVFPANLEPVEYKANREGEWVRRHNTITYYGSNVNDLKFEIKYRPTTHETYEALKKKLAGESQVEIAQEPTGVKVTVAATVLYPSGITVLSDTGKSVLSKVAETLKDRKNMNIKVEGHTDNVPIGPNLVSTFPTNWELASARSINVVHFLVEKGIEESRFESRAFSFHRRVASNETEEGKAKNRRIELLIVENGRK